MEKDGLISIKMEKDGLISIINPPEKKQSH